MTRIRLQLVAKDELRCVDPQGTSVVVPRMRLLTLLDFGPLDGAAVRTASSIRRALIDTGAALSVFPERVWRSFQHRIEWLTFAGHSASHQLPRVRVLGGEYPYRMGRVRVAAIDREGHRLPALPVIAQFTEDAGRLPRILMGMRGGILEGRRLLLDVARGQAWLGERGLLSRAFFRISSWLRGGKYLALS
jgi:hypothetical protein